MSTLMITGHRPDKLGNAYDQYAPVYYQLGSMLRGFILNHPEFTNFIDGGAIGADRMFEMVVNKLKRQAPGKYTHEIAVPCLNQDRKWSAESRVLYKQMLGLADTVTLVSNAPYSAEAMQLRNMYMVDRSDHVIAVWNGQPGGGTYNAIQYALSKNKPVTVFEPFTWKQYTLTSTVLNTILVTPKIPAQVDEKLPRVIIRADGSCNPNPGPGGWATKVYCDKKTEFNQGWALNTTNNAMEITAIKEGLKLVPKVVSGKCEVTIISDSKYCINSLNDWINKWKANTVIENGKTVWLATSGTPVQNQALWEEIDALRQNYTCTYVHVTRDKNAEMDERAKAQTEIAQKMLNKAIKGLTK
jgi:ribonuclease HI